MSLIDAFTEKFYFLEKRRMPDYQGGFITEYLTGASFNGALTLDTSLQARIAEREGVTDLYTLTVTKGVNLDYHDIIKRGNGERYRVTSNGDDNKTPNGAGLDMKQYKVEKWEGGK